MYEHDWYEEVEASLRRMPRERRVAAAQEAGQVYFTQVEGVRRPPWEIKEILQSLLTKIEDGGRLAPFMVVVAPDQGDLTPDDLSHWPAWNRLEVGRLWDLHDGRNLGTMVVAVYKLNAKDEPFYERDITWGMLGNVRKTRRSDIDDPEDRLSK